jgi:hypothetical protein
LNEDIGRECAQKILVRRCDDRAELRSRIDHAPQTPRDNRGTHPIQQRRKLIRKQNDAPGRARSRRF